MTDPYDVADLLNPDMSHPSVVALLALHREAYLRKNFVPPFELRTTRRILMRLRNELAPFCDWTHLTDILGIDKVYTVATGLEEFVCISGPQTHGTLVHENRAKYFHDTF